MNAYTINEISTESKIVLRTWICLTIESARECLAKRFDIAKTFNMIGGKDDPTNTLKYDFFFWDEMSLKYEIQKATLYE